MRERGTVNGCLPICIHILILVDKLHTIKSVPTWKLVYGDSNCSVPVVCRQDAPPNCLGKRMPCPGLLGRDTHLFPVRDLFILLPASLFWSLPLLSLFTSRSHPNSILLPTLRWASFSWPHFIYSRESMGRVSSCCIQTCLVEKSSLVFVLKQNFPGVAIQGFSCRAAIKEVIFKA